MKVVSEAFGDEAGAETRFGEFIYRLLSGFTHGESYALYQLVGEDAGAQLDEFTGTAKIAVTSASLGRIALTAVRPYATAVDRWHRINRVMSGEWAGAVTATLTELSRHALADDPARRDSS